MSNLRKSTEQTCGLFFEDSGGDVAVTVDTGQIARANFVKESKVVELSSPIHCNFFSLNRYIPPQTEVVLTLKRAPSDFVLLKNASTTANEYKIELLVAKLQVVRLTLSDPFPSQFEKTLTSKNGKILFKRSEIKLSYIPTTVYNSIHQNLLVGKLPEKVIFSLVPSTALAGNITLNPCSFKANGLRNIKVIVDSDGITTQEISVDATSGIIMEGYRSLLTLMQTADQGLPFSRSKYADGNMFFSFNLMPQNAQSTMQPIKMGTVRVELTFGAQVTVPLTLITYAQYDSVLEFDSQRNFNIIE